MGPLIHVCKHNESMATAIYKTLLAAIMAYASHYGITKVYSEFCVPSGVMGFVQGIITAGSPVCSTAFSVMSNTHITYSTIILTSLSRLMIDACVDSPSSRSSQSNPS